MKTIEDLNKLTQEWVVYFSYKEHGYYSPYIDVRIKKFVYNDKTNCLYIIHGENQKKWYQYGSKERCINKAIEDIEFHKALGTHCLYADPL